MRSRSSFQVFLPAVLGGLLFGVCGAAIAPKLALVVAIVSIATGLIQGYIAWYAKQAILRSPRSEVVDAWERSSNAGAYGASERDLNMVGVRRAISYARHIAGWFMLAAFGASAALVLFVYAALGG